MNRVTATDHCICNNVAAEEPNRSFLWDTDSGNPWPKHFRNEQVNSSREIKWPNTQTALDWDQRQIPIKSVWYDVFSQHNWAECLKCWVFAVPRSTSCSANRSLNLRAPVQTNLSRPWLTLEQFVAVNSRQTPRLPEHHTGCFNSIQWLPFTCQLSVSVTNALRIWSPTESSGTNRGSTERWWQKETTWDYWGVPTKRRGRCASCASLWLTLGNSRQAYLKPWSKEETSF